MTTQSSLPDNPAAVTPKHRYIALRSFVTQQERTLAQNRTNIEWTHIRPNSILVAAMGNHWAPGAWQRVSDMIMYTNHNGHYCALSEIQDRCLDPYDALGTMRNEAMITARTEGFEWLCYLDNDVLPAKETLLNLLRWDLPIVAPFVVEPGSGRQLHGPPHQPNSGLRPVKWCVLSMLIFRVSIFNCVGPRFWSDAVGADEGFHFQTLWLYGHRPYLDTNTQLVVAYQPTYPLATNRLSYA